MFEEQQEEDQQSSRRGTIILISIVLVLAIVGTLAYLDSKGHLRSTATSAATTASAPVALKGDPTKDLRVISTKVDKDPTGLAAAWLVDLRNESHTLTYSHIKYQTTYYGPNQSVIGQNTGEMPVTLGPGEEQSVQFNDVQYPDNLQLAHVAIVDAQASQ